MAGDPIVSDEEWWLAFRKVESCIREWLATSGNHTVRVLHFIPISTKAAEVYVFFETDADFASERDSGRLDRIEARIRGEFSTLLRQASTTDAFVRVDFDSHENVVKNYGGNYFLRLR